MLYFAGPPSYRQQVTSESGSGSVSMSHYHSATTASATTPTMGQRVTRSPPYLELLSTVSTTSASGSEYVSPRHQHIQEESSTNNNLICSCQSNNHQHRKGLFNIFIRKFFNLIFVLGNPSQPLENHDNSCDFTISNSNLQSNNVII